jgi:hypothetical protein
MDGRVKPGNDEAGLCSSPAGLTRGSIILRKKFFTKKMDGRVKPGHDECYTRQGRGQSFAAFASAAKLTCNDLTGFSVIAHGPHCDHCARAARSNAGVRATRQCAIPGGAGR